MSQKEHFNRKTVIPISIYTDGDLHLSQKIYVTIYVIFFSLMDFHHKKLGYLNSWICNISIQHDLFFCHYLGFKIPLCNFIS